jgi:hypothetical protein
MGPPPPTQGGENIARPIEHSKVAEFQVGSTRKLGVVEIPSRDFDDILHILRTESSYLTAGDTDFESLCRVVEEQIDRLGSYLRG